MEVVLEDFRQVILANQTVVANGASPVVGSFGNKEATVIVNVKGAVTGTSPTLTFTIQEVDPGDGTTLIGDSVTGAPITGVGTQILTLPMSRGGSIQVTWTIGGTASPTFNGVYATLVNKGASAGLYDNNNNGPVAVKPASTAAVATDPALVVAVSPNTPITTTATADVTSTGNLNALNAAVTVTHPGLYGVGFQLAAGTFVGTIVPEVSFDGGTTWNQAYFVNPSTGAVTSSLVFGASNTATGLAITSVGGAGQTRVRVSVFGSGTASATVRASDMRGHAPVVGLGSAGAPSGGILSTQVPNTASASTALGALNATVSIPLAGSAGAGMQLAAGTLVGTIVPEVSYDGGTTWNPTFFVDPATGNKTPSVVFASANGATARSFFGDSGVTNARVRVSAFTSGTANCTLNGSQVQVAESAFSGPNFSLIQPPEVAQIGGWDGQQLRAARMLPSNGLKVNDRHTWLQYMPNQSDTTLDTLANYGFWTSTVANGGTNVQGSGVITLATNTTASGSAILNSQDTAPLFPNATNEFRAFLQMGNTGVASNVRRWGVFTSTDGYFFILNGTALSFVTRKNSVDTATAITAFTLDTNFHDYTILYDGLAVVALVDDVLVFSSSRTPAAVLTFNDQLPLRFENTNTTIATNQTMLIRSCSVNGYGVKQRRGRYFHVTGAGTTVIKRGPGTLHSIQENNLSIGGSGTLYDNVAGSGTVITVLFSGITGGYPSDVDFTTGLTIVVSALATCDISIYFD